MCPPTSRTLHRTPEALSKYSPGRKPGCSPSSNLSPDKRSAGDPFDLTFALAADRTGQACEAATRWSAITTWTPGHQQLKERPRDSPDWLAYLLRGSASRRKDRCGRGPKVLKQVGATPSSTSALSAPRSQRLLHPACAPRAFRHQPVRRTTSAGPTVGAHCLVRFS